MEIVELSQKPAHLKTAISYFWKCWGNDANYSFYEDCMLHSMDADQVLPKFYIGLVDHKVMASYALITNDLISRQDLMPWFACLYVDEPHRKKGYAEMLLSHGLDESRKKGFENLYLSTDLVNFYERKGWTAFGKGYNFSGEAINIYQKSTKKLLPL